MRNAIAAVVTPAPSRESCCGESRSTWLDKLLQGESFTRTEWQQLEENEKVRGVVGW
jgi:hypothetical protein